jgi:type IV pilus assembly protein PilO
VKKQPWYVYLILVGLLGGLAFLGYFKPRQTELLRLQAERAQVETDVANLREKKKELDSIEAEMASLGASLAELETIIPNRREVGEMLRTVQQMAFDSDLDVIRFAPDRETAIDFYAEQPIPIEVVGTYHNLGLFFDRLLHYPRISNIDDFTIRALPNQSGPATISALFTAKTYFFLDQPAEKKPAAKRPAAESKELRP